MASVKRPLKLGFLQRDQIRMRQDHGIGQMTPCQDQQKESWPLGAIRPEWETEHESQGGTWKAVRVDFVFSYIDPATVSKKPQGKGAGDSMSCACQAVCQGRKGQQETLITTLRPVNWWQGCHGRRKLEKKYRDSVDFSSMCHRRI